MIGRSAALVPSLLLLALAASGAAQTAGVQPEPFRTVRGRVIAGDGSRLPLRRVKIVLAGRGIAATPAYTNDEGRFDISVPRTPSYALRLTKPGFAPLDVASAAFGAGSPVLRMARGAVITGRVVDQYGDALLARVVVRAASDAAVEWFADSDDLGEFRVGSLAAGRYQVTLQPLTRGNRGASVAREPVVVQLRPGQEEVLRLVYAGQPPDPRGMVIGASGTPVVDGGGVIGGSVIGPDGRGVAAAFVALTIDGRGARETTSDADGRYEFAGLPSGTYRITATKFGTSLSMRDRGLEVRVAERQRLDATHLVMQRPSAIVGSVLDEYGEPLEAVTVEVGRLSRGGGRALLQTGSLMALPRRTDDRGRFRLSGLGPGEYYVIAGEGDVAIDPEHSVRVYYPGAASIREAAPVMVLAGQDTLGVNITYAPAAGARVYGYALDSDGQPLTFPVSLMDSFRSGQPLMTRREARVRTDGAFTFLNVPPGEYVVQAVRRPAPERLDEIAIEHVTVGGGEVPLLTLRTSPGTTVRGRVELDGDTSDVRFEQFGVGVHPSDLDFSPIGLDLSGTGLEDDGTFTLRAQGPIRIVSRAAPQGWWLKSATIGAVDAAEQPYALPARSAAPIDAVVVFSDGVAEVGGHVTDDRGERVRTATVLLFPVDRSRWYLGSRYLKVARVGAVPLRSAQPVPAGSFRLPSVPPGDYWVVAVDQFDVASEWQDPDVLAALTAVAERITLGERQTVSRDLRLVERPRP